MPQDTPNQGYSRPDEGASNWDDPLNQNFSKLDTDVEVRDVEGNLGQYAPKTGAKFLAVDSGAVYLGDGSTWNLEAHVNRTVTAQPGNVQDALDLVRDENPPTTTQPPVWRGGKVELDPLQEYSQPDTPWEVWPGIILDFNGAMGVGVAGNPNTNWMHIHPTAQVHDPRIDLFNDNAGYDGNNPYDGSIFKVNSAWDGAYFADGTTVRGGVVMGAHSTGTLFEAELGGSPDHISMITFDLPGMTSPDEVFADQILGTGIHLNSNGGTGSFLNSLRFRGNLRGADTMILQEGPMPNNEHIVDAFVNQGDGASWFWDIRPGTFARGTVMRGVLWDLHRYADGTVWRIDAVDGDAGAVHSNIIKMASSLDPSHVVNNSGAIQRIHDPRTMVTTEV